MTAGSRAATPATRHQRATACPGSRCAGPGGHRLGVALVVAGLGMIPWLAALAALLPGTARVDHWAAAWTGLDCLEAAGLLETGALMIRRDPRCCLAAAVTASLLTVDAWLDVITAAPGTAQAIAVGMALIAELPLSALCAALALRTLPRGDPLSAQHAGPPRSSRR